MLEPDFVRIDGVSGAVAPQTGHYVKKLSDLRGLYQDAGAYDALLARGDGVAYEVQEYRKPGSDLFFGTTTMYPGQVAGEYFMTRGHYHVRPDLGEVYYTQRGQGVLLLENRAGETREVEMTPGSIAFIPPGWAHRSVNTGQEPLVFVWVLDVEAGNDYAEIPTRGMRRIVVADGGPQVRANPKHSG
jgi:glucose-6-phosphate isomerase